MATRATSKYRIIRTIMKPPQRTIGLFNCSLAITERSVSFLVGAVGFGRRALALRLPVLV